MTPDFPCARRPGNIAASGAARHFLNKVTKRLIGPFGSAGPVAPGGGGRRLRDDRDAVLRKLQGSSDADYAEREIGGAEEFLRRPAEDEEVVDAGLRRGGAEIRTRAEFLLKIVAKFVRGI